MAVLVFDGSYDAYFWVLCVDKYCKVRGIPENEKMALVATTMRGCALKWWNWWSPRHRGVSWNMFTIALLRRFKPEDREILPIVDDEEEPDQESSPLMELDDSSKELLNETLQAWDRFLLSTDDVDVPPMNVVNGENGDLPTATTNELIEKPQLLDDRKPDVKTTFADSSRLEPLIVDSVVERDYCGKETPLDMNNKRESSPIVIDQGVFNPSIHLSDPPYVVLVPPPPLAPPWLYHSFYSESLDSPPLTIESNARDCFQFQLDPEVLNGTPSQFDIPIPVQVINKLRENLARDASVNTRTFIPPFYACPILIIPLISVRGFSDFGTSVSDDHKSSYQTYHLFVESPLKTTFSWNVVLFLHKNTISTRLQIKLTFGSVMSAGVTFESLLLGLHNIGSFIEDYIEFFLECIALSYSYFIGFDCKLSHVTLGLTILVDSINSCNYSSLVADSLGYSASRYGYMSVLFSYGVGLIEVLFGKQPMEKIKSLIIGCCKPIIQCQQVLFSTCVLSCVYFVGLAKFPTSKLKENLVFWSVSTGLVFISGYESYCAMENTLFVLYLYANKGSFNNALRLVKSLQTRIFAYAPMIFDVSEPLLIDVVMYVLHALKLELAKVKTTMERKGETFENLKKCLEFEEMKFVLANYEVLVRKQHFCVSIALYVSAVHVLGVDVVSSQLIDIMESELELIYLGAAKDGGLVQEIEISPLAFRVLNYLITAFIFKQVNKLFSLELLADFSYVCCSFVLLEILELLDPPQSLVWNVRSKLQAEITCRLVYHYCGWVILVFEPDVEPFFIIHFVLVLHLSERTTCSNIPKFRVLTYLVAILQLATTICRAINDHELYYNVVLKRHVQESILIYFENFDGNSVDVVTLLSGCIVHKGSSQFNQWDPGGCSLIHWKGIYLFLEAWWKVTPITQQHYFTFNLEDKVDFNGGSNVMIHNNTCGNTISKIESVLEMRQMAIDPHF